jgi:hypothetical protein
MVALGQRFIGGGEQSAAMTEVRPLKKRDLSEVAELFARVRPNGDWSRFSEMCFANPWIDAALPSWIARDAGRIAGFIGVVPRPMRYRGKPARAAVLTPLIMQPVPQLLRAALAGPQDLALSDGANDALRQMWEACGGSTLALYGLQWRRRLRPASAVLGMLPDAFIARRMGLGQCSTLIEQSLTATSLFAALETFGNGYALRPRYTVAALDWLLAQARAKRRQTRLEAQLLRQGGRIAGWFLYSLDADASRVLQIAARPGREDAVLAHLFEHAFRRGARVIEGRMEPRFARALSRQHCSFVQQGVYVVAHARSPELAGALGSGDAFFSRFEGECSMSFAGETAAAAGQPATQAQRPRWARPLPATS